MKRDTHLGHNEETNTIDVLIIDEGQIVGAVPLTSATSDGIQTLITALVQLHDQMFSTPAGVTKH